MPDFSSVPDIMVKMIYPVFKSVGIIAGAALMLGLAGFMAVKPPFLDDAGFSRAVFDRHGALLRLTLSPDQKYRLFTPLHAIAPVLRAATLLHEDQYFYDHPGVNPAALLRAAWQTALGGRRIGASTITMQLARLKYRLYTRSPAGKLWQMLYALRLELYYGKDALLEAYLNRAPYGYNIEGIGAASRIYFRAAPGDLTLPQAVSLAVIPQSPARRRPEKQNPSKPALIQARGRLFARWLERHPEDRTQQLYFALPLATDAIADLPFAAPHLVQYLLAHDRAQAQIHATIDRDVQAILENILRRYVADRRETGIDNAAAVLVDVRTMQVMASIGSADFRNAAISGQVDGTHARRSPGSALKPFIYALAFDQGLIHPASILGDAPARFGSYHPGNFDRDFRGPISARDALRLSRNIPALKLAAQLQTPGLYEFFAAAGIAGLRPQQDYGLSLVLGGAEVTMRELAALYAMLAHDGRLRALIFQTGIAPDAGKRLLSAEASFMTLDILRDTPRPFRAEDRAKVYWKTGTSNGFHDAWAAGIAGPYALVVWAGNFNGRSNPALVGVRSAAPLFFALLDALRGQTPMPELIAGKTEQLRLRQVGVSAATGDLAQAGGADVTQTWFMPGVSPIRNQDIERPVLVNRMTGKRACHAVPGVTAERRITVWPSDWRQSLQAAGIEPPSLPEWEEGCTGRDAAAQPGRNPVITSPQPQLDYYARTGDDGGDAILLQATADGAAQELHWFIGNRWLGKSAPEQPLSWRPQPGQYAVRVVDDAGRSASLTPIKVLPAP